MLQPEILLSLDDGPHRTRALTRPYIQVGHCHLLWPTVNNTVIAIVTRLVRYETTFYNHSEKESKKVSVSMHSEMTRRVVNRNVIVPPNRL